MERDKLLNIISSTLGVTKEEIKDDSSFVDDLGADSLDITELILNIDDEFKIKIPDEEIAKFKTVKDVLDYLNRRDK